MLSILEGFIILTATLVGLYGSIKQTRDERGNLNWHGWFSIVLSTTAAIALFIVFTLSNANKDEMNRYLEGLSQDVFFSFSFIYGSEALNEHLLTLANSQGRNDKWQRPKTMPIQLARKLCDFGAILYVIPKGKLAKVSTFADIKSTYSHRAFTENNCVDEYVEKEITYTKTVSTGLEIRKDMALLYESETFNTFTLRGTDILVVPVKSNGQSRLNSSIRGQFVLSDNKWKVCVEPKKKIINDTVYYHISFPDRVKKFKENKCEI